MTKNKQKHSYIFPDFIAKAMSKVDLRTQYEASMMSMSLMSIGLVITITYLLLYIDFKWWYKVLIIINGFAGLVFMWSFITTTYQQYKAYIETVDFQKEMRQMKGGKHGAKEKTQSNK